MISKKKYLFLSAKWNNLLFANYSVDYKLLEPLVPKDTELDYWNGECFISVVAFQFLDSKLFGIMPALSQRNFDEINLRFYVRRKPQENYSRKGVVFIKEIVPSRLVAFIANNLFGENYVFRNMRHDIGDSLNNNFDISYSFKNDRSWNKFSAEISQDYILPKPGCIEEYITEHYWGYGSSSNNSTIEYEVEHPQWIVYKVKKFNLDFDFGNVYGDKFSFLTKTEPSSVFFCVGSDVNVRFGNKI